MGRNRNRNRFHVGKYVFIVKAYHVPACSDGFLLSGDVVLVDVVVLATVDFNDQLFLNAREISDERFDRVLATELQTA